MLRRFDTRAEVALLSGFQQRNLADLLQVAANDVGTEGIVGRPRTADVDAHLPVPFVSPHRSPWRERATFEPFRARPGARYLCCRTLLDSAHDANSRAVR